MASPAPEKKRSFRLGRVLLAVLALVLLLVGAGLLFRTELATWAARSYLESEGVAVGGLEVTALWMDSIEVRDISLGANRELVVERLHVMPELPTDGGILHFVEIMGMVLHLDVTGDRPLFGSLQATVDRLAAKQTPAAPEAEDRTTGDGDATVSAGIPVSIVFRKSTVVIETPSGPMTAEFRGELSQSSDGSQTAQAVLDADSDLGRMKADLDVRRGTDGHLQLTAEIADGRLAWQDFQVGAFSGRLAAALPVEGAPQLDAVFDLAELAYAPAEGPALRLASGHLEARGQPAEADLSMTMEGAEERLALTASARQQTASEGLWSTIRLQGEVRTAGGLTQFLPLPEPKIARGSLSFQASGEGNLLGEASAAGTWQALPALTRDRRLSLQGEAVLADVALADGTEGISARLPLNLDVAEGSAVFTLREDATVRIDKPSRARLQALGLPDDFLPLIASGLSLTLAAGGERPFRLTAATDWPPREAAVAVAARAASDQGVTLSAVLDGEARLNDDLALAAFRGTIDAGAEAKRVALGGREARNLRLALPLSARYDAEGLALALTRAGALRIDQFAGGAPLRLQDPLSFTVSALTLETPPDGAGYSYRLSAGEDGANFAVTLAEAEPVPVEAGALGLRLAGSFRSDRGHDAALEIRLAGLGLPGYAFAAEAAEVDVTLDRELRPAASRFALGPLVVGGAAPLAAPLRLDGTLQRHAKNGGAGYDIAAILALAGGLRPVQPLADITARLSDRGEAQLEAVSRFITFDPEGLQPGDLSPRLAELKNVRGSLTAQARLAWPLDPAAESGRLSLAGLSFESPVGAVEGLDLDVILTGLLPLASAPDQQLTIRRLDAAVPVEAVALVFALDQSPQPHLTVSDGGFDLGGARWRIAPTTLDPAARRNAIAFATEALDLTTFFRLIEVEGLSGSGTLKGRIPIAFEGEDVIVEDGRFEALGPGKLQIRFEALRAALAGGGEYVELAAQAMEDFHFDNLSIAVSKTAANDATVRLSTLGRNPAVLDGQPFQFNINLESNLTSVLAALRQGYSLSDDALRRAWRLRE